MKFKENPLKEHTDRLEALNKRLGGLRNAFLMLKAEKDHFRASLVVAQPGKSHAERLIQAQATGTWLEFHQKMARAEAEYEFMNLQYEIMEKTWQSSYLVLKLDHELINKQE